MNQVFVVLGLHILASFGAALWFRPRIGPDAWILALFSFGWMLDSKSGLGNLAYASQLLAGLFMVASLASKGDPRNKLSAQSLVLQRVFFGAIAFVIAQAVTCLLLGDSPEGMVRFALLGIAVRYSMTFRLDRALEAFNLLVTFMLLYALTVATAGLSNVDVYLSRESGGSRFGGLLGHPNYAAYVAVAAALYLLPK